MADPAYTYLKSLYPTLDDLGDLLDAFVEANQLGSWQNVLSEKYWPNNLSLLVTGASVAINDAGDVLLINDTDSLLY